MTNLAKRRRGFRNWRSVVVMTILLTAIAFMGHGYAIAGDLKEDMKHLKSNFLVKAQEVDTLKGDNETLKDKLARSATYQTPESVKSVSRYYINKYFSGQAPRVTTVMTCESGLDNRRDHTNKDGSIDGGLYQIHDEPAHRKNIARMFPGVPFEVVVHDFDMSSKYAKWLWDRSPRNWVCDQLI